MHFLTLPSLISNSILSSSTHSTVGFELGLEEGGEEILILGLVEGLELGLNEGGEEMLILGLVEGLELGLDEGGEEMLILGLDDGSIVGEYVGVIVGAGDTVGAAVGKEHREMNCSQASLQ